MVELALVFPLLFLLFLSFTQIIIFLQSLTATEYAAFVAARSFQVYGDKTLGDIQYPHVTSSPFTNSQQTIAEAAAEKVIFESLVWENKRIKLQNTAEPLSRIYEDGNHATYHSNGGVGNAPGAVHVEFKGCAQGSACEGGLGVKVHYCLPIVFPFLETFFESSTKQWPCKGQALGRSYNGIAISREALLGRMPL